jgi:hypothetical protein
MSQTNDRNLPADLRDLQIFLRRSFPDIPSIPLYVDRHYGSWAHEIAFVVVGLPDQASRRRVRALAEAGLRHLGYEIANRGRDVYDVWPDRRDASAHEAIRAVKRFAGVADGSGNDALGATGPREPGRAAGGRTESR